MSNYFSDRKSYLCAVIIRFDIFLESLSNCICTISEFLFRIFNFFKYSIIVFHLAFVWLTDIWFLSKFATKKLSAKVNGWPSKVDGQLPTVLFPVYFKAFFERTFLVKPAIVFCIQKIKSRIFQPINKILIFS